MARVPLRQPAAEEERDAQPHMAKRPRYSARKKMANLKPNSVSSAMISDSASGRSKGVRFLRRQRREEEEEADEVPRVTGATCGCPVEGALVLDDARER